MKPDEKTRELLRNITVEIGAGMVLFPRTPEDRAWNGASDRARTIIQNYAEGDGLFQLTRGLSAVSAPTETPEQPARASDPAPRPLPRKAAGRKIARAKRR